MFDLNKIVRPNILKLEPYSSARDEYQGDAAVLLDANESPYGNGLNRYPDPYQRELKVAIAPSKGVRDNQIFLGNGSDEAIDLLFRIFCEPGVDNVIVNPPTYGMYKVSADINNVQVKEVSLTQDYQLNVPAIIDATDDNTKLIFICSPNNPTGNDIEWKDIMVLADNFDGIVIVDEAYIDFSSAPSTTRLVDEYPNLVVLQTFSKAWGLAGIRLGMAIASPQIIRLFNKVKPPYNVDTFSQRMALQAVQEPTVKMEYVGKILALRAEVEQALQDIDEVLEIKPSSANFLLVKVRSPKLLYNFLANLNIIVRNRSNVPGCEGCLRITIGSEEQNGLLLAAIRKFNDNAVKESSVLN